MQCVESTFVSSVGPFVDRFEQGVADAAGARHGVATASGTTGLHVSLVAAGVVPGDLVIMPSYTFIATANAVAHCQATPWLLDINAKDWTLDVALLRRVLDSETYQVDGATFHRDSGRRVAAIVPVHVLGLPASMDEIVSIADRFNLALIADAAAALGAIRDGKRVGEMGSMVSVLSFNGNKTLTCGGGGCVVGDDEGLMKRIRHLSTTARVGDGYTHDEVGFNYRMTNVQAAIGCAQLDRWQLLVESKQEIKRRYDAAFCGNPALGAFPDTGSGMSACWFSGVTLSHAIDAELFRQKLRDAGLDVRPFWKPVHLQPPYLNAPRTEMAVCDDLWRRVVPLPCSTNLTTSEQDFCIEAVIAAVDSPK